MTNEGMKRAKEIVGALDRLRRNLNAVSDPANKTVEIVFREGGYDDRGTYITPSKDFEVTVRRAIKAELESQILQLEREFEAL